MPKRSRKRIVVELPEAKTPDEIQAAKAIMDRVDDLTRALGPRRPPRVTDEGDDGMAGAPAPKKPRPTILSGAAAAAVPIEGNMNKPKPPADPARAAKSILDQVIGDADRVDAPAKDPAAVELGRRGGLKGGQARAKALTPQQRKESARKAAEARWGRKAKD